MTPRPQPGNPKPRLFRIVESEALINRMGFNNDGLEAFLANVARARHRGVLGLNIGKNFDTPNERAVDDYLACLRGVYAHAAYVAVNVSSPNTKGLRDLQHEDALGGLAEDAEGRAGQARRPARQVHAAGDQDRAGPRTDRRSRVSRGCWCATASTASSRPTRRSRATRCAAVRHADEAGGLSGAPLRERGPPPSSRRWRRRSTARCRSSASAASCPAPTRREKIDAGAALVQVYTGIIYRGPDLVAECVRATAGGAQGMRR